MQPDIAILSAYQPTQGKPQDDEAAESTKPEARERHTTCPHRTRTLAQGSQESYEHLSPKDVGENAAAATGG